ncbi:MAG TPA: peptidoglycan-binding protein LysM [Betaproteobacteria bacterium]|nr:peptidoglycan-binding protein LysM [Betaproteobacteria bacterium]
MRKLIIPFLLLFLSTCLPVSGADISLQSHAPARYTVVKGDTLWGIAGKFLKNPWQWPQIWQLNRQKIANPDLIYPGDVIVLTRENGVPVLRLLRGSALPTVTLSPKVYAEPSSFRAIPSIPPEIIEPFLTQPLVVANDALNKAPRIVAAQDHRVILGAGDIAYVSGLGDSQQNRWQIYRPGKMLVDPVSHESLGREAVYLGIARLVRKGKPATIQIVQSTQEINIGDRLVSAPEETVPVFIPHAPEKPVSGEIISAFGGITEFGQNAIVVINRGKRNGIDNGAVLALYRRGNDFDIKAETEGGVKLPLERYGLILVFRTFDKVAYALVTTITRPVHLYDLVKNP